MGTGRNILSGDEARQLLVQSVSLLAKSVKPTFSNSFKHTLLGTQSSLSPSRIFRSVRVDDPHLNAGIRAIESMIKTTNETSDLTLSLSILILNKLAAELVKAQQAEISQARLLEGIDKVLSQLTENIESKCFTPEDEAPFQRLLHHLLRGDEALITIVDKVIKEERRALVLFGDVKGLKIEEFDGLHVPSGPFQSPLPSQDPQEVEWIDQPNVLLIDGPLESTTALAAHLKYHTSSKAPLLIFATAFGEDAIATLEANDQKGIVKSLPIRISNKDNTVQQVSLATGAKPISPASGLSLAKSGKEVLGTATQTIIQRNDCFLHMKGDKTSQTKKITAIFTNPKDIERKQLLENGLLCARAAKEGGLVPGCGSALLFAAQDLSSETLRNLEEKIALQILEQGAREPLYTLAENLGLEGSVVAAEISKQGWPFGLNVFTQKVENLIECGMVDAKQIVVQGLEVAVQAAISIMQTDKLVVTAQRD